MTCWVAFLRSVNVGGTGKLPMSRLRQSATGLGLTNARTYLASGNLLFSSSEQDSWALESLLEERISDEMGLDTTVMVRSPDELTAAVDTNPFQAPESELHIALRKDRSASPNGPRLAELAARVAPDEFAVVPGDVHLRYPNGQARSKLTACPRARTGDARHGARHPNGEGDP